MSLPEGQDVPDRGLLSRAVGIVVSPGDTLRTVLRFPRPAGILLLVCAVLAATAVAPQFTARGRRAAVDLQVQQLERMTGKPVTPQMYEQLERTAAGPARWFAVLGIFVGVPVATVFFSALYWAAFNILLGGSATFGQVLGVVAHSQVITALGAAAAAPFQFLQQVPSAAGPFSLVALAPMLDPSGYPAAVLSMINVFTIWATVVTAIGLALLYRRTLAPILVALLVVQVVVSGLFAGIPFLLSR
jgi:hypothetical protein